MRNVKIREILTGEEGWVTETQWDHIKTAMQTNSLFQFLLREERPGEALGAAGYWRGFANGSNGYVALQIEDQLL